MKEYVCPKGFELCSIGGANSTFTYHGKARKVSGRLIKKKSSNTVYFHGQDDNGKWGTFRLDKMEF